MIKLCNGTTIKLFNVHVLNSILFFQSKHPFIDSKTFKIFEENQRMSAQNSPILVPKKANQQSLIRKKRTSTSMHNLIGNDQSSKSSTVNKSLPSLNYSEPDQIKFIKQCYENFSNAVSRFMIASSTDVSYKDKLKMRLTDSDWNFNVFFTYLMKQNNILMQTRYNTINNLAPSRGNFIHATDKFTADLKKLIDLLNSIQVNGINEIVNSLKINFSKVNENLIKVIEHPSVHENMHDPLIPVAKMLQTKAFKMRNFILKMRDRSELQHQHQVLLDMRQFSSDLNNAFATEFTRCSYGLIENEKIRSVSMACCNDILHGMKAMINFKSQMNKSLSEFEKFKENINPILENFCLPILDEDFFTHIDEEEEKEEDKQLKPEINESMTLKEILESSYKWNKKNTTDEKFLDKFYSILQDKAKAIEDNETDILTKLSDLQIQNVELLSQVKVFESQKLKQESSIHSALGDKTLDQYYTCIKEVSDCLRIYLGQNPADFVAIDNVHLIENVKLLAESLKDRRCPNCVNLEKEANQTRSILRQISSKEMDLVTLAKNAKEEYFKLRENYESLSNDLYKIGSGYDSNMSQIYEILKEFPLADKKSNEPCREIINQIRLERDNHKAQIIEEQKKAAKRYRDREKEICNKFSMMFGTYHAQPIFDQFEFHLEAFQKEHSLMNEYSHCLHRVEEVLINFLNTTIPSNTDVIITVPELIEKLKNYKNPLEDTLKEYEQKQIKAVQAMNEIEKKVLNIMHREQVDCKMNFDDCVASLTSIIENIETIVDEVERNKRLKKWIDTNIHTKLELIDNKLNAFLMCDDADIENMDINEIISRISNFTDKVIASAMGNTPISIDSVNKNFEDVMPLISEHNQNDPVKYLPEISMNYKIYSDSIESLKPFSEILNDIGLLLENKEKRDKAFDSRTENYKELRMNIFKLHDSLNTMRLTKIHSLVFLVLSRFVAIISTFLTALSSMPNQK